MSRSVGAANGSGASGRRTTRSSTTPGAAPAVPCCSSAPRASGSRRSSSYAIDDASDFRLVRITGVESEMAFGYAGLLLLRVVVGLVLIGHGTQKLFGQSLGTVAP